MIHSVTLNLQNAKSHTNKMNDGFDKGERAKSLVPIDQNNADCHQDERHQDFDGQGFA